MTVPQALQDLRLTLIASASTTTSAWLWPHSGVCSRSTPTWLGRDYRTAVRLRALVSSKPTRGPAAAGIRLGFGLGSVGSLISLRCARSRRWVRGHSEGLRRLATMTNQRFVWQRSQALSLLGRSLAANLHQAACMRYFLPPASIRARPAGLRAGGGQQRAAAQS
jgi:hypothetical protein